MVRPFFPATVAVVFVVYFAVLAIDPRSREVWIAEIIPVVLVFTGLVISYRHFRFSNLAYGFMAVWMFWHTLGAHFTFAHVPFDWINALLGGTRNHFDRISHFTVGFYAFPTTEWLLRRGHCRLIPATVFGLLLVMSIAAAYEIIEWWFAVLAGGDAGLEFLGSQGDVWDAQKDMLADTLGAVFALTVYLFVRPDRDPALNHSTTPTDRDAG